MNQVEEQFQDINIHIDNYKGDKPIEIIKRFGEVIPSQVLPIKEPVNADICGTISSPLEWLKKRIDTIEQKKAVIRVDRDEMTINLTVNERDYYSMVNIKGSIQLTDVYKKFGINDPSVSWEPAKLGQFIRLNRAAFDNKEESMKLVSLLKNFKANTQAEIARQKDPSGSVASVYRMAMESNLPQSFTINIPIFKGTEKTSITVEFDHYLRDNEPMLQLVSPGANEVKECYKDIVINENIEAIRKIAPDIVIIEL